MASERDTELVSVSFYTNSPGMMPFKITHAGLRIPLNFYNNNNNFNCCGLFRLIRAKNEKWKEKQHMLYVV